MSQKIALVTGGIPGIGKAVAKRLAESGHGVVSTGRNEQTLQEAAAPHEAISYVVADVSNSAAIHRTLKEVEERCGRLDVLVNNAGVAPLVPLAQVTEQHIHDVFSPNVQGRIQMTQASLPLRRASQGNIVNISSVLGDRPYPRRPHLHRGKELPGRC